MRHRLVGVFRCSPRSQLYRRNILNLPISRPFKHISTFKSGTMEPQSSLDYSQWSNERLIERVMELEKQLKVQQEQ